MLNLSARTLASMIARREISPVELLERCLERIEEVDPFVNAMVTLDRNGARAAARAAETAVRDGEALGPLHGLPVGIKDLNPTAGLRTTYGSLVHRDNVPSEDDLIVSRLRRAGGIVVGKTNTPEFGAGANTLNRVFGATVNPFDPRLSCAGSSGGSAVALATGMVPVASGSDMGGSLRTPAAFCGIAGYRPSAGAVPSVTRRHGWSPLSTDGPMGRDVADTALQMAAIVGQSAADPLSFDLSPAAFLDLEPVDTRDLRVAFSADLGCVPVARQVADHFRSVAQRIAPLFGRAEAADPDLGDVHRIFETLRGANYIDAYGDFLARHRALAGPNVIRNTDAAMRLTPIEIARAQADQTDLVRRFQRFFDEFDVLVCPAASVVPFPVEEIFVPTIDGADLPSYLTWISITYAITLTTHPATVIPCGLGPTGMPFGLQIVGRWREDARTLAVAAAIERELQALPGLARPEPDLVALRERESWAHRVPSALEIHSVESGRTLPAYRDARS